MPLLPQLVKTHAVQVMRTYSGLRFQAKRIDLMFWETGFGQCLSTVVTLRKKKGYGFLYKDNMTTLELKNMGKETVVNCIEAPSLEGIWTKPFIDFIRLRELYEEQIEENARRTKEEIVPTYYLASIEDKNLWTFIAAGWIEANSVVEITKRQFHECRDTWCKCKMDGEHLYLIKRAIRMPMVRAENRVWTFHCKYCSALRKAGYADIQITEQHASIAHITRSLKPQQLHEWMLVIVEFKKKENFHKEIFARFMREVAAQAENL